MESKIDKPAKSRFNFSNILPNNEKVRHRLEMEKLEEEERIKINMEKQKKRDEINSEEILKQQQIEKEIKQKQKDLENQIADIRARRKEIGKKEGNLSNVIRQLLSNTSSYELSFAGLDLDEWNFLSLMLFLPENMSLLTLNLSRKNFNISHSKHIADMLKKNKKLRKLELEGNEFGPECAKFFAEALRVNKALKYLDLENNNLTNKGQDSDGIIALFEALKENTTLISLNLDNNFLTPACGQAILHCLRKNNTLIHLQLYDNQRFEEWNKENPKHSTKGENDSKFLREGLTINQIYDIKEAIKRNRNLYDKMRTEEWKERKNMKNDETEIKNYKINIDRIKIEDEMKITDKNNIEKFYLDEYNNYVEDLDRNFLQQVDQYFAETIERKKKKTTRR